jgi:hypothetical protein
MQSLPKYPSKRPAWFFHVGRFAFKTGGTRRKVLESSVHDRDAQKDSNPWNRDEKPLPVPVRIEKNLQVVPVFKKFLMSALFFSD